ncbi:vacuole protein [Daedalea quercina L-15889]|uniref:Vacuole protein n=1 Tax=Daedalea quercina L-15889 TaxID=1314783 RepID=A0A165MR49_9APHY|nr:vacuole protein [Daedalea quercina L-15889]
MCGGGNWKREVVPDHKFDFVDTRDFTDHSCGMRMKYLWLYITVFISFLVYISDIFTAVTMLTSTTWSNEIYNSCQQADHNGCVYIPFSVGKWLFFGCIVFSFLLLAYEARKAKKIIASRDISYAFTNVMANHYYSLRSYDHFCFFNHISSSTKRSDDFAFFVFFTFKGWKRVIFAEGPRQSINALTLYALYLSRKGDGEWYDISKYFSGNNYITIAITISTAFTTFIFALSLLMLVIAGICYIPLLTYIQGNLKEYCCHKVDKRIAEIIKRRNKQRLAKAAALAKKEAAGDFSHLKNSRGEFIAKPLPQPTLPNVMLDDDDDKASMRSRGPPASTISANPYYETKDAYSPTEYPPMPAYNPAYGQHQYNQSVGTFDAPSPYEDDYGSTAHLATSAAPFARTDPGRSGMENPYSYYGEAYGESPAESDYQQQQRGASGGAAYDGVPWCAS